MFLPTDRCSVPYDIHKSPGDGQWKIVDTTDQWETRTQGPRLGSITSNDPNECWYTNLSNVFEQAVYKVVKLKLEKRAKSEVKKKWNKFDRVFFKKV